MTRILAYGAIALAVSLTSSAPTAAGEWTWTVTPYIWATDVGVDVNLDGRQIVNEEIPVSDLIEDVDAILQLRVEAQHGRHGVLLDLFGVKLSDEMDGVALPKGVGEVALDSDSSMTIVDLAGLYDPKGDHQGFSYVYGARIIGLATDIDATFVLSAGPSVDQHYKTDQRLYDGLAGVRYTKRFGDSRVGCQMQADVSAGGTDLTWSANPSITIALGQSGRYGLTAGYRHMVVDFKDENDIDSKMTLSGPLVGIRMSF